MIKIINLKLNKNCKSFHLPSRLFVIIFRIFERLKIKLPIKSEQIERLNEHKSFSYLAAKKIFNFDPINIKEGLKIEVKKYNKLIKK